MTTTDFPGKVVHENISALGLSKDLWTLDGEPGYLVIDNRGSEDAFNQYVYVACWADETELPITLTIAEGVGRDTVFTFHRPDRVRFDLPTVPPGESGIFAIRTDKTWTPKDGDERTLGVHLSTTVAL